MGANSRASFTLQQELSKAVHPFLRQIAQILAKVPFKRLPANVNFLGRKTVTDMGLGNTDQLLPALVPFHVVRSQGGFKKRLASPTRNIEKKRTGVFANPKGFFLPFPCEKCFWFLFSSCTPLLK